jgi:hypothetical protein
MIRMSITAAAEAERKTLLPFISQELRGKYFPPPPSLEHLSEDEVEQLLLADIQKEFETNKSRWRQKYREQRAFKEIQRRNQFREDRLARAKVETETQKAERLRAERVRKKQQRFLEERSEPGHEN